MNHASRQLALTLAACALLAGPSAANADSASQVDRSKEGVWHIPAGFSSTTLAWLKRPASYLVCRPADFDRPQRSVFIVTENGPITHSDSNRTTVSMGLTKGSCVVVKARYISLEITPKADRDARVYGTYRRLEDGLLSHVTAWDMRYDQTTRLDSQDLPLVTSDQLALARLCRKPDLPIDNGPPKSPRTVVWADGKLVLTERLDKKNPAYFPDASCVDVEGGQIWTGFDFGANSLDPRGANGSLYLSPVSRPSAIEGAR